MFGGLAMLLDGNMAVGVRKDGLIVRTDPDQHERLLTEEGARPFDMTGRPMKGWLVVDASGELQLDAGLETVQQADAATQQHRHLVDRELVEQAGPQALLHDVRPHEGYLFLTGGGPRLFDSTFDPLGDERVALAADSLNEGKYRLGVSPSLYHLKSRWPPIPNGCSGPSSAPAMNPSTDVDRAVTTIVMLASSPGTVPGHPAPPAVRRASWSWRLGSARGGAMVSIDLLGIYLNDHLGGSIAGVEVAEKLRSKNEGTPFGTTLSGLVLEVKEDRATLENLMDRLGIERNPANADFHATGSAQGSGELVAQGAVAP